jgi:hypothetical protein
MTHLTCVFSFALFCMLPHFDQTLMYYFLILDLYGMYYGLYLFCWEDCMTNVFVKPYVYVSRSVHVAAVMSPTIFLSLRCDNVCIYIYRPRRATRNLEFRTVSDIGFEGSFFILLLFLFFLMCVCVGWGAGWENMIGVTEGEYVSV